MSRRLQHLRGDGGGAGLLLPKGRRLRRRESRRCVFFARGDQGGEVVEGAEVEVAGLKDDDGGGGGFGF